MKRLLAIIVLLLLALPASAAAPLSVGGRVFKWGGTVEGQAALSSWTNMVQVSGNSYWMVGLRDNGSLASFGQKAAVNGTHPTNGVYTYVAAGWSHGLAITNGGGLVEWGVPYTTHTIGVDWITPTTGTYTKVAAGDDHSAAIRSDGVVITWGGRVSNTSKSGIYSNAVDIACTWYATAIVHSNGTVTTFGEYSRPGSYITVPASATNVVAIEASRFNFVARRADGTMVAWGYTDTSGYTTSQANSYDCKGYMSGDAHMIQLNSDGTVTAWGSNASGQATVPSGLVSAAAIGAQYNYSWAIQSSDSGEPPSNNTVRYVRKDGSDSNTGYTDSPTGALLTIAAAMQDAVPGMTIYLGAGTWEETLTTETSGTATSRIVVDGRSIATIWNASFFHSNWTLQNCTVSGKTNAHTRLVQPALGGHNLIVSNCVIDAQYAADVSGVEWNPGSVNPIDTSCATNVLVINNTLRNFAMEPAIITAGRGNTISGNFVYNNDKGDWIQPFGYDITITGNTFSNSFDSGLFADHADAVQIYGNTGDGATNVVIEKNIFRKGGGMQLLQLEADAVPEISNWTIRNNLFIDIGIKGEVLIPNMTIENNTFYGCSTNEGAGGHVLYIGYDSDGAGSWAENIVIRNNAFVNCGQGPTNEGWYAFTANWIANATNYTTSHNYVGTGTGYQAPDIGTDGPLAAGYDAGEFYETDGIAGGDPGMVNVAGADFRLLGVSPLINAGYANSLADDLDGNVRDTPDIGAYEYVGAPLVWLKFEDDFSDGQLDDSSGNAAHALRYGWGTTGTNWPTPISPGAPLNLVGANFRPYYDSRPYSSFPTYWDGQYAAVTNVPAPLLTATNFSALLWARFDDLPAGTNSTDSKDNLATFLSSGWDSAGCWMFGRYYSTTYGEPKFLVVTNAGDLSASYQLSFPQVGQYTNDSWRHYAVTVDCTTPTAPVVKLYTNGVLYATHTLAATVPYLTIADPPGAHPPWIGLSCWTHNTTPELGVDKRPNTGWHHGAMDDVRIYNRTLGPAEIAAIATTGEDPGPVADATNPRMRGGSLRGGTLR
jgi:alpha-tubulin suppressor-like RCC1 family protein